MFSYPNIIKSKINRNHFIDALSSFSCIFTKYCATTYAKVGSTNMAQHGCGNSEDVIKTEWVEDGNNDILI